ncbi:hypothetical protein DB31_3067 [Hyalangium minutum]|uniref:Uncharacterized protein n=1 Tax=Hyalangium minutum TaxID=394096 RepID=A0A085W5P5_9BACT|nr:hypothetical protein DB31_3067 [Hyalangium minutum]
MARSTSWLALASRSNSFPPARGPPGLTKCAAMLPAPLGLYQADDPPRLPPEREAGPSPGKRI